MRREGENETEGGKGEWVGLEKKGIGGNGFLSFVV